MRVTKSMCSADCWTDHRLIVTKLNIRVQPKRRPLGKKAPKRLNITQLKTPIPNSVLWTSWKYVWNPPLWTARMWRPTGRPLKSWSTTQLLRSWGPRPESTRTGLTKTATRLSSYWMRNTVSIKPTSVAPSPPRRKMHTTPYAKLYSRNSVRCKTLG